MAKRNLSYSADREVEVLPEKQLTGIAQSVRKQVSAWAYTRSDLMCVITQLGERTAIKFRRPLRGVITGEKFSPPLTPIQRNEIRAFATKLGHEYGLTVRGCTLKCVNGHSWYIVTFA